MLTHSCSHNILDFQHAEEAFIGAFLGKLSLIQTNDSFSEKVIYEPTDIQRAVLAGNLLTREVIKSSGLNGVDVDDVKRLLDK